MAGGRKETRLAQIGAFGLPLGGLDRRFDTLTIGNVIDGEQNPSLRGGPRRDLARVKTVLRQKRG